MQLSEIRTQIDSIDAQLKELLLARLGCSEQVAAAKREAGSTEIYRPERAAAILARLGADVDPATKPEYLAVVSKVIETSRMYQYGLLYDADPAIFEQVSGHELCGASTSSITARLTCENKPGAMGAALSIVGDWGYNARRLDLLTQDESAASFELQIVGNACEPAMRKLLFQLASETLEFRIVGTEV